MTWRCWRKGCSSCVGIHWCIYVQKESDDDITIVLAMMTIVNVWMGIVD